jgi:hypothetical protein
MQYGWSAGRMFFCGMLSGTAIRSSIPLHGIKDPAVFSDLVIQAGIIKTSEMRSNAAIKKTGGICLMGRTGEYY